MQIEDYIRLIREKAQVNGHDFTIEDVPLQDRAEVKAEMRRMKNE